MRDGAPLVALVILDGWGLAPPGPGNAVELAETPVFDALVARQPHGQLAASGRDVGLPAGQMGNSEVGHLNIGAGRIVAQDLVRIGDAVDDGSFFRIPALVDACRRARTGARTLHLMGLVSDGGVHSHVDHLRALVRLAVNEGVERVAVHAITDGRDVSPMQAAGLLARLEDEWRDGPARIATVAGRLWAMDRDRRWERTERFYAAVVDRRGPTAPDAMAAVQASHAAGVTDEFVEPTVILPAERGRIEAGDELVFFNFRPDRARQICAALADPAFTGFERGRSAPLPRLTAMAPYWEGQPGDVAFPNERPTEVLADVLAEHGLAQLHMAETEKYAHVTYFLNGGVEAPHPGEERILIPSPRDVKTYDEKPQMSAEELTERFVTEVAGGAYRFVVINFANPDMVGHTGVIPAVVQACETVDRCLGRVLDAVAALGGTAIVTADHGNAERMLEADGSPHTAHTTNRVPVIAVGPGAVNRRLEDGRLADLAPTVLDLLGVPAPAAMTGRPLLVADDGPRG